METSNWMASLDKNISLGSLHLPGTHNSAAAKKIKISQTPNIEHSTGLNVLRHLSWLPGVKFFTKKWVLTQSKTVAEQLEFGIRAFDFRILYNPSDEQLYLSHSFILGKLEPVLQEIRDFMDAHPNEIIVLRIRPDFEHEDITANHHDKAYDLIESYLKDLLITTTAPKNYKLDEDKFKIGHLQAANERILLIYQDCPDKKSKPSVWGEKVLDTHWANESTAAEVVEDFKDKSNADEICVSIMKESNTAVTPDARSIVRNTAKSFFSLGLYRPYGLKKEASKSNEGMLAFLKENPDYQEATNFISMDFPSNSNVEDVIESNRSLKP